MKQPSKSQRIFFYLWKGHKITQRIAIRKFQYYRLAVVIERLRKKGFNITTTMRKQNDCTFAEYKMIKP